MVAKVNAVVLFRRGNVAALYVGEAGKSIAVVLQYYVPNIIEIRERL